MSKGSLDGVRNGVPIKLVWWKDNQGKFLKIKEQPKLSQIPHGTPCSGVHIFASSPEQNHYDIFKEGTRIKKYVSDTPGMKFPYEIFGFVIYSTTAILKITQSLSEINGK